MPARSIAILTLALVSGAVFWTPAFAARHHAKATGACAQSAGRCIADCDDLHWCQVYACVGGKSSPVAFWRCFEPSGLCLAPHC